jgi:hypothetical protein
MIGAGEMIAGRSVTGILEEAVGLGGCVSRCNSDETVLSAETEQSAVAAEVYSNKLFLDVHGKHK